MFLFFRPSVLFAAFFPLMGAVAQCAYTCSNYIVSPLTYTNYPGNGTQLSLLDDDVTTTLPLGFNFDYFCTTYNQVRIASNGFITFDFGSINMAMTPYAQALPHPNSPNAVIAWNWNDLDPSTATGGGAITYTTVGTSPNQKFIVTYSAVPLWTTSAPPPSTLLNTGQIVLNEGSNLIEIHITQANNNGWLTHTEGIEDQTGTYGIAVMSPPRNLSLWQANFSSHLFSPYSIAASVTVTGPTSLCEGDAAVYTATASPPPLSYNWVFPNGWSGTSSTNTIAVTAGVGGSVKVSANYTCGASSPATLAVSVTPAPQPFVSSVSNTLVCSGSTISVNGGGAASYTLQPGGVTGPFPMIVSPPVTTTYSLYGTGSSGCISVKPSTVVITVKPSPTLSVNSGGICLGATFSIQATGADTYTYSSGFANITPSSPGIFQYSVVGTATNSCKSVPAISSVTVHAPPPILPTAPRKIICRGESVQLSATGGTSYLWSHDSSTAVIITVSPTLATTYTLNGVDAFGCSNSGKITIQVSSCVGLEASSAVYGLRIFPNPFEGEFSVDCTEEAVLLITDLSGKTIMARALKKGTHVVEWPDVSPGVYLLTARFNSGASSHRLIVSR
jgi:hypothetical protein